MLTQEHLDYIASIPEKWDCRNAMYRALRLGRAGVELGVKHGDNAANLLKIAKPSKMVLVDRWRSVPNPLDLKGVKKYAKKQDSRFAWVKERFSKQIKAKVVQVIRATTEDTSYSFLDNTFDWIYIDANHKFAAVLLDIQLWVPKLKVGGHIMLHDFTERISHGGVVEACYYELNNERFKPIGKTKLHESLRAECPSVVYKKLSE